MKTLREIIKESGYTNKAVADALGISETNIKRYDNLMKRSLEDIIKIANALNMPVDKLVEISFPQQLPVASTEDRLLSIIESQQRTIENLTKR